MLHRALALSALLATATAQQTCADINGDGTADDAFDCSGHTNTIDAAPAGVACAADPCTDTECCTVAPPDRKSVV